ncbi:TetR/AcrR family transcriptional regulator [Actinomycetospora sp. TBRC 11914]|uniref:TetR/AcrR family transcriptional regulator n=1 Tax=Actinomycetospora sp. TBRC 11914 TaxID=2729387 RepID=UPI00145D1BB5|nr:TetR/AcrR family transcriptional regulator [Actinomycetospora sp. TBRC 11914]NMO90501.1 TetR/AcrR family transcriptional regulator [Actinomycetospora sp. TBRC 11914]
MTRARARPGGRSAAKQEAVLRGGLTVFARDGYTRAAIDAIAREADVSTRTIYNHYADKAGLFAAVIVASATRVARARTALLAEHLDRPDPDLAGLARAWATPDPEFAEHFALVLQVRAEVHHVPAAAREAWLDAGPRRVQAALAARIGRLAERGLLHAEDPDRAAAHFVALVAGEVSSRTVNGLLPMPPAEIHASADAGLAAFLRAYGPRR